MRKIKQLTLVLAGALAAYLLFVAAMRLRGPTPAQATALAVLNQPTPPVVGRDASDAFWLLDHEVPADKQASVAAELRYHLWTMIAALIAAVLAGADLFGMPVVPWRRIGWAGAPLLVVLVLASAWRVLPMG